MPVVLDDEMLLVPPSMRRPRHYVERERIIEVPSNQSTSTIDLPPHRVEYERPRSPLVIHQEDHIIQLPLQEVELFRGREYVIEPAGSRVGRYYRRSGAHSEMDFTRGRARSVGYDVYDSYCSSCDEEEYYIDDGYTHGSSRSVTAGHVIGGGSLVSGRRRRMRRSPGPTLGAQKLYNQHHGHQHHGHQHEHMRHSEEDPNRRIRHLAEAGLGIAAVGAAKEIYDARARRARSRSSSSSSDEVSRHKGRHIAVAALGATAAGLAAHKYAESHRRGSSSDCSSDSGRNTHRGRKVAAGLGAAATAAGLAKVIHDRHRHGSRSRSSSASSAYSADGHHRMRRAAAGLGGATAFHRSRSRSHSRPGMLRHRRSSSTSSTSSADSGSHKFRKAALGAGAVAGAAALARHAKHHRERSRSRTGILRRRSRTVSPPHRSRSRGASLAKAAAVTAAGALAQHQVRKTLEDRRARSVDAARRRRHRGHGHREHGHREHGHHRHHDDDSSTTHSRRGSGVGGMLRRAITGGGGGHHPHPHERYEGGSEYRNTVAQEVAYRVGEATAAGVRRATSRPRQ